MKRSPVPTMRDVAARAGVSPMTVSRTLSSDDRVAPELRDRVLAAVSALGYRRNTLARGLRRGESLGLVGLAVTNLANPFYSELAVGVEQVLTEHGLQLVVGNTADRPDREQHLVSDLVSRGVDGLIVVPSGATHPHLEEARAHHTPVVLATCPPDGVVADSVVVDDFGGAREMSRRLVLEGHRRIAFLGLPHPAWTADERLRGFRAGQQEFDRPTEQELVVPLPAEDGAADTLLGEVMARPDPPTAVFGVNNRNTLAACRWVAKTGRELRVTGFDAIRTAELFRMPVSLVTYSAADVGRRAARLLVDRIGDRSDPAAPPRQQIVPTAVRTYGEPDPA